MKSGREFQTAYTAAKINNGISCGVRSKKDHSVLNNGTTGDAAFRQQFFDCMLLLLLLLSQAAQ